ncbi:TniQ family protein [Streptomyces luteireticuli]|uniref:TniQ family protein n=1 Tax=Streptomyces luteireticuli TaxID=173858 RepID=UPI003558182B
MTNPRNRQLDRAVRKYQREHPGTTLDQARKAVAARAGRQRSLPARIPSAPLPRPTETLAGYVQRVATAAGVQRHQAMELLGLEPGTSATHRLDELAAHLPDRTIQALRAATGMTTAQAHALTSPGAARPAEETARRILQENLNGKSFRRGGEGKTSISPGLAAALALGFAEQAHMTDRNAPALARLLAQETQRPLVIDTDRPRDLAWPGPALHQPDLLDLPWPADGKTPPADPDLVDEILKQLGITPSPRDRPTP